MSTEQRKRILRLVERLSPEKLDALESLLATLECGDLSTLSNRAMAEDTLSLNQRALLAHSPSPSPQISLPPTREWPHVPVHRLSEHGTYIVTAGTLHKQHLFVGPEKLDLIEGEFLRQAKVFGWNLEAWAVFSNHYHFVGHSPENKSDRRNFFKHFHAESALKLNRMDDSTGRSIWHGFWDTQLTFEKSYLARLNYVHQNAVKHGLVKIASDYRWCSAAWFEQTATRAQVKTISSFKTDKVRVEDDFEPIIAQSN